MTTSTSGEPRARLATGRFACAARIVAGALLLAVSLPCAAAPARSRGSGDRDRAPGPRARVEVDATEAPRHVLHTRVLLPVKPGPLTLVYPKWIPGEHGPTGPVVDMAGLSLTTGGRKVSWTRDPVDLFAIRCEVPPGATSLEAAFDFLRPPTKEGFSSASSATK